MSLSVRALLLAWLAAVLAAPGCSDLDASNPYDPSTPPEQQATGIVRGRLQAPEGVEAEDAFGEGAVRLLGPEAVRGQGERQSGVRPDGAFELTGVVAGVYQVIVEIPGFSAPVRIVELGLGESADLGDIPLTVALDARLSGIARLQGAPDGAHGGVGVEVVGLDRFTVTRPDGAWTTDVAAGAWTLRFTHPGYTTAEVAEVRVGLGQAIEVPEVVLVGAPGALHGRVRFAPGFDEAPAPRPVEVRLVRADGGEGAEQVSTVLEGAAFTFTGLAPGGYEVAAHFGAFRSLPTLVEVPPGTDVGAGMLVLQPPDAAEVAFGLVRGTAQREGAPNGAHGGISIDAVGTPYAGQTTPDGLFELSLPPASYTLRASSAGHAEATVAVTVEAGQTVELESPLLLAGQPAIVRGRVAFAPGYENDGEARVVEVSLSRAEDGAAAPRVQSVAEGTAFVFDALPAGRYVARASFESFVSEPREVAVGPGADAVVDPLVLAPVPERFGTVRGTARLEGAPDGGHGGILIDAVGVPQSAFTNADGAFELRLPAGNRTLRASAAGYAPATLAVEVPVGPPVELAAPLLLAGEPGLIRGLVALAPSDGRPFDPALLREVQVSLYADGEEATRRTVAPDAQGAFVLDGVPAGFWRLDVTLDGFQPGRWLGLVEPGRPSVVEPFLLRTVGDAGGPRTFVVGLARLDCGDGCEHGGIVVEAENEPFVTQTTADGRFRLEVAGRPLQLVFRHPGYAPERRTMPRIEEGLENPFPTAEEPEPLVLRAADGRVSGQVVLTRFATAQRLADVSVALRTPAGGLVQSATPDPAGLFAFEAVRPGRYRVEADGPGFARASSEVEVAGDTEAHVGALALFHQSETAEAVPFEAQVILDDGAPAVGTALRLLFADTGEPFAAALADTEGRVSLPASPEERYLVSATHAGYGPVDRAGGFGWSPVRRAFVDDDGAPVAVTLARNPLDGAITFGVRLSPDWVPAEARAAQVRLVGAADRRSVDALREADGPTTFRGLSAGAWLVRVERPGFAPFESLVELSEQQREVDLGLIELPIVDLGLADLDLQGTSLHSGDIPPGVRLVGADLSRVTLRGDFSGKDLSGADLTNAVFAPGTSLRGVGLSRARLFGADLAGIDLEGADLSFATLFGADLSGARLGGANLLYANLTAADFRGATFLAAGEGPASPPCGAGGPAVVLQGVVLAQANLERATLRGVNLEGATLSSARLFGADLSDACLRQAIVTLTDLSRSILDGADLSRAQLASAVMIGTRLRGADLTGATATSVVADQADLGCRQRSAEDDTCDCARPLEDWLPGAACDGGGPASCACRTRLTGATFNGATLIGVRFDGAALRDAAFVGAVFGDAAASVEDRRPLETRAFDCDPPPGCTPAALGGCPRACTLAPTTFEGALADGADFSGVRLTHVDLAGLRARRAAMNDTVFARCRLDGADLAGAELVGARLPAQRLEGVSLDDAILDRAELVEAELTDCSLDRAALDALDLRGARLTRVSMREADLRTTLLDDLQPTALDLTRADVSGRTLTDLIFTELVAPDADFRGTRLDGVALRHAHLERARFDGASLRNVDLSRSWLNEAVFDGGEVEGEGTLAVEAFQGGALIDGQSLLLPGADLTGASFRQVRWQGAVAMRRPYYDDADQGGRDDGTGRDPTTALVVNTDFACTDAPEPAREDESFRGGLVWPREMRGAIFDGCGLSGEHDRVVGLAMREVSFQRATFFVGSRVDADARLELGNFSCLDCDFRDTVFYQALLRAVDVTGSDFGGAIFVTSELSAVVARGASFADTEYGFVTIEGSEMQGASFARMRSAGRLRFRGVDLHDADFRGAMPVDPPGMPGQTPRIYFEPAFELARQYTDLTGANFTGVDCSRFPLCWDNRVAPIYQNWFQGAAVRPPLACPP